MLRIPSFFVRRYRIVFGFLRSVLRQCATMQIIAATYHSQKGRLIFAMTVSVLLHMSPFIASLFKFSPQGAGRQIVLQVSLQAVPDKLIAKPIARADHGHRKSPNKRHVPDKKQKKSSNPSQANVLTGNSAIKIAPVKEETQHEPESKTSEQESHEARLIEGPGAPTYPAEAVQRKLESCVLAAVYVSAAGEVEKVAILHADIPEIFDASVIEAQTATHYLPARSVHGLVASRVLAVASFVLEPEHFRNCAIRYADVARKINGLPATAEISPAMLEGISREN